MRSCGPRYAGHGPTIWLHVVGGQIRHSDADRRVLVGRVVVVVGVDPVVAAAAGAGNIPRDADVKPDRLQRGV